MCHAHARTLVVLWIVGFCIGEAQYGWPTGNNSPLPIFPRQQILLQSLEDSLDLLEKERGTHTSEKIVPQSWQMSITGAQVDGGTMSCKARTPE